MAVEDDRLAPVLAYLANGAVQPRAPIAAMRYDVRGHGPYVVAEEGDHFTTVHSPDDVLFVVYARCHARLVEHMGLGGWIALHAGIAVIAGRRALMIGAKGVGKTTLALRLLYDGHAVEGDEVVYARGREAVSQPRNFHAKPPTRLLVPELADVWASLPSTSTSDGLVIRAFDPSAARFEWTIDEGPIDIAFVLQGNHGGAASCRPIGALAGVAAAVSNAFPTPSPPSTLVRACAALLGDTAVHELVIGDLAETAALIARTTTEGSLRLPDEPHYAPRSRSGGDRG